jgi:hypothetical protein
MLSKLTLQSFPENKALLPCRRCRSVLGSDWFGVTAPEFPLGLSMLDTEIRCPILAGIRHLHEHQSAKMWTFPASIMLSGFLYWAFRQIGGLGGAVDSTVPSTD